MSSSVVTGHCSRCHKIWTLKERQGVCPWCGKPASCNNATSKPRHIKSRSNGRKRQAPRNGNGYDHLEGEWITYYRVASRFTDRVKAEDREDILHTIIVTLADVGRNNGQKPPCQARGRLFTEAVMYRIASRTVADYWYQHYKVNNGLDCRHCAKAQRDKCREDGLYSECPKAIKLESLNRPILDSEGNLTELGELIADDKAMELDAWVSDSTWEIGYPKRLVDIAYKIKAGEVLSDRDRQYLCRYRRLQQKTLF